MAKNVHLSSADWIFSKPVEIKKGVRPLAI
jgi:hypothetical protein